MAATSAPGDKQAELEWEARAGRWAAIAAYLTALFILGSLVYSIGSLPKAQSQTNQQLLQTHTHHSQTTVAAILSSLAYLFLIPVLLYLYRCTRFRRQQLPTVSQWLAIIGPLLVAVLQVVLTIKQIHVADKFAAGAVHTKKHADDLIRHDTQALSGIFFGARVVLGFAFVMIALNAMRAGLLSRFMGVLGVILGVLFALPILPAPPLQIFWLAAVGYLFQGRWPAYGRGPAWAAGEEIPWPSAAERAAQARGEEPVAEAQTNGRAELPAAPDPAPEPAAAGPRSRKRRNKRAGR